MYVAFISVTWLCFACRESILFCSTIILGACLGEERKQVKRCDVKFSGPIPRGCMIYAHFCLFLRLLFPTVLLQIYLTKAFTTHVASPFLLP